ncbi:MAG TPA: phage holin family protein [Clostridia bacterium]|nr:phage holin family protein [Clostridia bacterium]
MKGFLRNILISFMALFLVARATGAVVYSESYVILFWAAFSLTLLNLLVKPVLNLLLTPINLLTLGAFRWVVNVLVLLLATILVPGFRIASFVFPGLSFAGFIVPSLNFTFFWALILVSFLLELTSSFVNWALK